MCQHPGAGQGSLSPPVEGSLALEGKQNLPLRGRSRSPQARVLVPVSLSVSDSQGHSRSAASLNLQLWEGVAGDLRSDAPSQAGGGHRAAGRGARTLPGESPLEQGPVPGAAAGRLFLGPKLAAQRVLSLEGQGLQLPATHGPRAWHVAELR